MTFDPRLESGVAESPVAESLQRRLRGMTVSLLVLWLVTVGLGLWFYIDARQRADAIAKVAARASRDARQRTEDNRQRANEIAKVAAQSTAALCAIRRDLEHRVANGHEFLRTHPHGIAGIPAKTLLNQINGQQRTIDLLGPILTCPPEIRP